MPVVQVGRALRVERVQAVSPADAFGPNGMPSRTPDWWIPWVEGHAEHPEILGARVQLAEQPTLMAARPQFMTPQIGDVGIVFRVEFHNGLWFLAVSFGAVGYGRDVWLRPYHVLPLPGEHWAGEDL